MVSFMPFSSLMATVKAEIDLYVIEKQKERRIELKMSQENLAFRLGVFYLLIR